MQTERDAEIVGWVGRLGAASAEHVASRFQMGRSWVYERLSGLVADGLLEQRALLHRRPALYVATVASLRWRGLGRLGVCRVRPGDFDHAWALVDTVLGAAPGAAWLAGARRGQDPTRTQALAADPRGAAAGLAAHHSLRRFAAAWLHTAARDRPTAHTIRFDGIGVIVDEADRLVSLDHIEGAW
jgi:DNA-binding IclR family transcriptional regulator